VITLDNSIVAVENKIVLIKKMNWRNLMSAKHNAMGILFATTILVLIAGCSTATTTPTVDLKSMALTAAWQTIQATMPKISSTVMPALTQDLTQSSLTTPPPFPPLPQANATLSPSTITTKVTTTITPTVRILATFVGSGTTTATSTVKPTTGVIQAPPDRATISWESPLDYAQYYPNTQFTKTWRLKNIGSTTWSKDYLVRFWAGSGGRMGANDITLGSDVKPGQEIEISMNFTSPGDGGDYISNWVLGTDQGGNFFLFFVAVTITDQPASGGATSTRGVIVPTATPK
jgi:hypothetical protein